MNWNRTLDNISERKLLGQLLTTFFTPPIRLSTMDWGRKYRTITATESTIAVGEFDPNVMPYMEYVYDCLDNPYIPYIVSKKSARIGWTEVINTWLGKRIHLQPSKILVGFATLQQARVFAAGKWKDFVKNTPVLKKLINIGVAKNKENMYDMTFAGGSLRFATLGAITNQKGENIPVIVIEEPDDVKDDVSGQGDSFLNIMQRFKTVPDTQKKFVFGGTGTKKDFSRVEKAMKQSNCMIFKACCHSCQGLVPLDETAFVNITYQEFGNRYIDSIYGKFDPTTAAFHCPFCKADWSFEQKTQNIIAGKQFGFTDHTGNFSKGWHQKNPRVTKTFGFDFSELMSTFKDGSNYISLAEDLILAELELSKGNEAPMMSFTNNRKGGTYAGGFTAMEAEEMKTLRSNYPEGIAPYEALIPFMGIDVQHNRFALIQLAAGRNGNLYLIKWEEIFGNVFNWEDPVWTELTNKVLNGVQHATGQNLSIETTGIDSGDGKTVELVYRWVKMMNEVHGKDVRATKGSRELKFSTDDIYSEPNNAVVLTANNVRKTLAETMGVPVYMLGTHRCHDEILRRIVLNKQRDESGIVIAKHDVFYFNEQSYGGFEEQLTACRKLIDPTGNGIKEKYELIPGKHMDAMAATKNAFFAYYARGIRHMTDAHWAALERGTYGN